MELVFYAKKGILMNKVLKFFKNFIKEVIILFTIVGIAMLVLSYIRKPEIKDENLPSLTLTTLNQKKINTKDYKNKPLILHFWATWCPTCRLENSSIEYLSKKYQVLTIAVSSKDLKEYMSKNEYTFETVDDPNGVLAKKFKIEAFPTTFIYNKEGKVSFVEVGYSTTAGVMARVELID